MIGTFNIGAKQAVSDPASGGGGCCGGGGGSSHEHDHDHDHAATGGGCGSGGGKSKGGCGTGAATQSNGEAELFAKLAQEQARAGGHNQLNIEADTGFLTNMWRLLGKHGKYLIKYPHITRRVIQNYFKLVVLRQPVLRQVEFAVTYWCNAYCDHCSATTMHRSGPSEMDLPLVERVMQEAIGLGALSINITGGEALQHPQILDIIKAAQPKKVVVSLASNGLLLTQSMAQKIAESGVRIASLALDSADPAVHDERKKIKGCYDALMKATKNCQENGIEVFLCTILTPVNMANGDAWKMVELAERTGCMLTVNIANAVGSWMGNKEVLLSEPQVAMFHDMVKHPRVRWDGGSNYLKSGCPAGIEKIYVSSFGEVTPCPRIHLSYGNVKEETLTSIWHRMVRPEGEWGKVYRGGCPIGDDAEFRDRVMKPIEDAGGRLHVSQHPSLAGNAR